MKWEDKVVLVTGGAGFLGSHVVDALAARGCQRIVVPRSQEHDLVDRFAVHALLHDVRPDLVLHLAARVGGIGANQRNPGLFFYENLQMGLNVIEEARLCGVQKVVVTGTVCAYPKHAPVPFREEDLWNGYPEETNAPYGIAKKSLLVMAQAYREQYGLRAIVLFPVNLYGPRDSFDLANGHVIPAVMRKLLEAGERREPEVVLWGDGTPTREFLYVEDCAEALLLAAERYDDPEPVNIGSGREIAMSDLAALLARMTGFTGTIRWDASRPNGQPRRRLDTSRACERFGFEAKTTLEEGLARTLAWYRAHQEAT